MKVKSTEFIKDLRDENEKARQTIIGFGSYPIAHLNFKSSIKQWSILECIEHLNLYSRFYLPEIEKAIIAAPISDSHYFQSNFLGNYFVNMIKASNSKKIKATRQMDSTGSDLNSLTLNRFIENLQILDTLLQKSLRVDLSKVKTAISLTKLLKLRLGDTLRFLVYHNERHILQAKRINLKGII